MNKYKKVSQDDVFAQICSAVLCYNGPGIISVPNLAFLLNTSKYQVRKHIASLKESGLVERDSCMIYDEYENYPPYNGFTLTKLGLESEQFKEIYAEDQKAWAECCEEIKENN